MNRKVLAILTTAALTLAAAPAFAADGAAVFKAKCAMCHGADGAGKGKLRDLGSPEVQKQTDKELYTWTADGKGKMPAYKTKLSEAELNAVVAYMRTLAKK